MTTTSTLLEQRDDLGSRWMGLLAVAIAFGHLWLEFSSVAARVIIGSGGLLVLGLVAVRAWRRVGGPSELSGWRQAELAGLSLATLFTALPIAQAIAPGWDAQPIAYLTLALLVAFSRRATAMLSLVLALSLHWATWAVAGGSITLEAAVQHSFYYVVFAAFTSLVFSMDMWERRRVHRIEVAHKKDELMREAHEFRLLSSGRWRVDQIDGGARDDAEELLGRDAVDAIHQSVYLTLSLLKTALQCNTAVLLWFDVRNEQLTVKELCSDSDGVVERPIDPAKGVLGGITRRRESVVLRSIRRGFRGLSYYRSQDDAGRVTQFLGVPVIERGNLRGVLCLDRVGNAPEFSDAEAGVVEDAANYIVRAVVNERVFVNTDRSRFELGRFFEATRRLNGVLTPEQVYEVALGCLHDVAPYDVAAITLWDEATDKHVVVAADGAAEELESARSWIGREFASNSGFVSMVVKNKHYLPFGGVLRDAKPLVFTRDEDLAGFKSLLVTPLLAHDEPIGTVVVARRSDAAADRFTAERREMLEVITRQVAVTLQNARLYAQMEEMATTDGLTQLVNHRTFQSKLEESIARSRRTRNAFAMLLVDIDHFKSVNDTYGHPVGDDVLRAVAACFRETLRATDVPARYGGEEFAVILEDTDSDEAIFIAERLRNEIKKLSFDTVKGTFNVTISVGVNVWTAEHDSVGKQGFIDSTDKALYASKHGGRDRVTLAEFAARKAS